MKRRDFIGLGVVSVVGGVAWAQAPGTSGATAKPAAGGAKVTAKDILREGQPATIANYCEKPEKQPNKFCPAWNKTGHCGDCMFYNKDNSATTFEGKKVARCQLLADPKKAQFVFETAYCATYVKKT